MKVIAVCGSARKNGNTEALLGAALDGARKAGAKTELITLCDKSIKMCDGCCYCDTAKKCHIKDDMAKVFAKLLSTDAIIFGTPCYWDNMSGLLKNFFDRMNAFCIDRPLNGKKAGIVAVSGGGKEHADHAIGAVRRFTEAQKMHFAASMGAKAYKPGEIKNDAKKMADARALGEAVARMR